MSRYVLFVLLLLLVAGPAPAQFLWWPWTYHTPTHTDNDPANSVGLWVRRADVVCKSGWCGVATAPLLNYQEMPSQPICNTVPVYGDEHVVSARGGVALSPDHFLTAHAVTPAECDQRAVVFGYMATAEATFPESSVFYCQEVLDTYRWTSLVRLDRPVDYFAKVSTDRSGPLRVFHFPLGLAMQLGGAVYRHEFYYSGYVLPGSSGGGVFNAAGHLLGVIDIGWSGWFANNEGCWEQVADPIRGWLRASVDWDP